MNVSLKVTAWASCRVAILHCARPNLTSETPNAWKAIYLEIASEHFWTYRKPSFHQIARREESWQDPARPRVVTSHYHRARRVVSFLTMSDGILQRHAVSCDRRRMVDYSSTPIWRGNSLEETFLPHFNLHLQALQFVADEHLIFFQGHDLPSPLCRQISTGAPIGQSRERTYLSKSTQLWTRRTNMNALPCQTQRTTYLTSHD